jgi:hypothetical protein
MKGRKEKERKENEDFFQIIKILYLKINFIFHIFFSRKKNEIILHY